MQESTESTLIDFRNGLGDFGGNIVNDGVMGGLSYGSFESVHGCAEFSGEVSLENSGGFASVRCPIAPREMSGKAAFLLRVRGDGKSYKFNVRIDNHADSPSFQRRFTTEADRWIEIRLPFDTFVPTFRGRILDDVRAFDPIGIKSIGFLISDRQQGPFRLEIEWIKAVS